MIDYLMLLIALALRPVLYMPWYVYIGSGFLILMCMGLFLICRDYNDYEDDRAQEARER
jgi:hypothetical protein